MIGKLVSYKSSNPITRSTRIGTVVAQDDDGKWLIALGCTALEQMRNEPPGGFDIVSKTESEISVIAESDAQSIRNG